MKLAVALVTKSAMEDREAVLAGEIKRGCYEPDCLRGGEEMLFLLCDRTQQNCEEEREDELGKKPRDDGRISRERHVIVPS